MTHQQEPSSTVPTGKEKTFSLESKIQKILKDNEETRNSDTILYAYYLNAYFSGILKADLITFMLKVDEGVIPSLPTIQKIRRRIQGKDKDLARNSELKKPALRNAIKIPVKL